MKRVVYSDILDIDKICSVYHKIMYNIISIYLKIINYICLFHLLIKGE